MDVNRDMRLILFEMRKIFFNKITIFISLFVITLICSVGISDVSEWKERIGDVDAYNTLVTPYEGKVNKDLAIEFDRKLNESEKIGNVDTNNQDNTNPEENRILEFYIKYCEASRKSDNWLSSSHENKDFPISITGLTDLCSRLESENKTETYEYKDNLKHLNMLKECGEPEFYNNTGWVRLFSVITGIIGIISISLVCVIVIAPIFSNEQKNGMELLILSTKMGRNKIIIAKLLASYAFVIVYVTLFYLCNALVYLVPTKISIFKSIPLNSIYQFTPFNITVLEALGITYCLSILSFCTLASIFCFISVVNKKNVSSIICALLFSIVPLFVIDSGKIAHIFSLFPSVVCNGNILFKSYHSYNIMGHPIEYLNMAVICLIIMLFAGILLTVRSYNKKLI